MILGYLDGNKKNIDIESQRQQILDYATKKGLKVDMFVQESKIEALKFCLKTDNHTLIFANIVALGTSLLEIKESISMLALLNLTIISIKEGYVWKPEDLAQIPSGLELVIAIRNSLTSIVTRRALAERKRQGVRLGRKTPNKKRALDDKIDEIILRKKQGETNLQIANAFGVAAVTLYAFYRKHPEIKAQIFGDNNA